LPSALANCERKYCVDAAEHVLGSALGVADADVRDEVDELAEALLIERGVARTLSAVRP